MGNLPSQEKSLIIPAASADTSQLPLPTQAVPSAFQALAFCDFPSSVGVATVLRMGEQVRILSEWLYEGISREKAEELLLHPGNHSGSFLIRKSHTRQVSHCRIHQLDNGWLYFSPRLTFPSLHNLVDHYSEFSEGLCCPLSKPCFMEGPRAAPAHTALTVIKKPSLHWDKIESSLLFSETTSLSENSPISHGLREAISSYLILSETDTPEPNPTGKVVKNS